MIQGAGILTIAACAVTLGTCIATGPPTSPPTGFASDDQMFDHEQRHTFHIDDGSELRLNGSATIGSWSSVSERIDGTFAPGLELAQIRALIDRVREAGEKRDDWRFDLEPAHAPVVRLAVPVTSLRSGKPGMERDMREALRAEAHPHVTYEFHSVKDADWTFDTDRQRVVFELTTKGDLSLAGVDRRIEMGVRIEPMADDRFRVVGQRTFDMEEFDIEPPTALFGLIRADQTVEVVFDLVIAPAEDDADHADDANDA